MKTNLHNLPGKYKYQKYVKQSITYESSGANYCTITLLGFMYTYRYRKCFVVNMSKLNCIFTGKKVKRN